MFFELVEAAGGRFFGPELRAAFETAAGAWALGFIRDLYGTWGVTPQEVPEWEFDGVTAAFDAGRVAMIGDWPATYAAHAASAVGDRFDVALYPAGPAGRFVYSGGFTWAIPASARDPELAMWLLLHLSDETSQRVEAERGTLVPRGRVQAEIRAGAAAGSRDERRLGLLAETMATSLLIPPRFAAYPAVEDAVWPVLRRAMVGEIAIEDELREAARAMNLVVGVG